MAGASASAPDTSVGAGLTNLSRFQSTPGGVTQIARGPRGEKIALDHDECGRVIKRRVHRDGFRPQVWLYTWDVHDRLVGCTDPDGVRWVYAYDPFGRRLSKQRRFGEQELIYVRARWPELVADQPDLPERGSHYLREIAPGGHQPGDKAPPVTGTFYMWDGDQMVQEALLRLDGTIDETSATLWHYEEGDHTPLAKQLPSGELQYITTDHLGTPKEMFDEAGDLVWSATHYVWGAVRAVKMYGGGAGTATAWSDGGSINGGGTNGAAPAWQGKQGASLVPARERAQAEGAARELICPFRFPGQYEDVETGLNYNRHRYYDALTGQYCSPDPIGLAGGDRPQGYVDRPGSWIDPLGLAASAGKPEVFYRTMSPSDYKSMKKTGNVPKTSETFISPSQTYSKDYTGVLVKITVKPGTKAQLEKIGRRHKGNKLTKEARPDMPDANKGWGENHTMFKHETPRNGIGPTVENIGLGKGTGLNTFNDNITKFGKIP